MCMATYALTISFTLKKGVSCHVYFNFSHLKSTLYSSNNPSSFTHQDSECMSLILVILKCKCAHLKFTGFFSGLPQVFWSLLRSNCRYVRHTKLREFETESYMCAFGAWDEKTIHVTFSDDRASSSSANVEQYLTIEKFYGIFVYRRGWNISNYVACCMTPWWSSVSNVTHGITIGV